MSDEEKEPVSGITPITRFTGGLLPPELPVRFEARNAKPSYRRTVRYGDVYTVDIEVPEEAWEVLKSIPVDAIFDIVLYWHTGDPPTEQPKTEKAKAKGPWGDYWNALFRDGLQNNRELKEILGVAALGNPNAVREALHLVFDVTSLAAVAPDEFIEWSEASGLDAIANMARLHTGPPRELP